MTKWFQNLLVVLILATLVCLPTLGLGWVNLGLAEGTSNPSEASQEYETAAKFLFWRTDLYEKAGLLAMAEPDRAMTLLTKASQHGNLSPFGQFSLAQALLASGDTSQAVTLLEGLLNDHQQISPAASLLAKIYRDAGQIDLETSVFQRWLESDPKNSEANEGLGLIMAARAAPGALPLLQEAASLSEAASNRLDNLINALQVPGEQAYRFARCGQALAQLNEWRLAEVAFNGAVAANPGYGEAWAWQGLARQHNGTPGAQESLESAVKLNPGSASIHAMFGTYLLQGGQVDEAVHQFNQATQLEPANPAWWAALGSAAAQSDLSMALNAYIQAVDLAPDDAIYWYDLAAFCVDRNAYLEDYGLKAALQAYALEPENPLYMDMLGRAQSMLGLSEPAQVMFQKALAAGGPPTQLAMIHFHLGLLYLQTARSEQAKFEFQEVLTLDPPGSYASQAQKLLERYFP